MGNAQSDDARKNTSSLAHTVQFDKEKLVELHTKFKIQLGLIPDPDAEEKELTAEEKALDDVAAQLDRTHKVGLLEIEEQGALSPHHVSEAQFREALKAVAFASADAQILLRMFTMADKTGDDQTDIKDFSVSVSVLVAGSVAERLAFAFELYDVDGTGQMGRDDVGRVVDTLNSAASYFGDAPMAPADQGTLVDDIFLKADTDDDGALAYKDYTRAMGAPTVSSGQNGRASSRRKRNVARCAPRPCASSMS